MAAYAPATSTILVASDSATDAALVKKLLDPGFRKVLPSIDPVRVAEGFDNRRPDVPGFNALEKSECRYPELLHLGGTVQVQPYRTI